MSFNEEQANGGSVYCLISLEEIHWEKSELNFSEKNKWCINMRKSLFKKTGINFKCIQFLALNLDHSINYTLLSKVFSDMFYLFFVSLNPKKPSCLWFFLCFTQLAKPVLIFPPFNASLCLSPFCSNVGKSGNSPLCYAVSQLWSTAKLLLQSCLKASALSQNHHVQSFSQPTQQFSF